MATTTPLDEVTRAYLARYAKALDAMITTALEHDCGVVVEWDSGSSYWQMYVDELAPARTIRERRVPKGDMRRACPKTGPFGRTSDPF